jgi:hypothetical protein
MATKKILSIVVVLAIIVALFLFMRPSGEQAPVEGEQPEVPTPGAEETPAAPEIPAGEAPAPTEEANETPPATATPWEAPQLKITGFINRPTSPKTGETASLTLNVKNVGYTSPETTVEFFLDGELIDTQPLPSLTNGVSSVLKTEWVVEGPGTYVATVSIKPVAGEIYTDDNNGKTTVLVFE